MFTKVVRLRRDVDAQQSARVAASAQGGHQTTESGESSAVAQEAHGQEQEQTQEAKPKRDRKNRQKEKPKFIEEVIWEDGKAVEPPRRVEAAVTQDK